MVVTPSPKKAGGNQPWEDRHTQSLIRAIIGLLLTSRPSLYRVPGLDGEVDGHGGDRISRKVVDQCKKMARDNGMDPKIVQEITAAAKGNPAKGVKRVNEEGAKGKGKKTKVEKTEMKSDESD